MKSYLISLDKIPNFVDELARHGSVYYPRTEDGKAHFVVHREDAGVEPDFTGIRTAENMKHFFFHSRDVVARFPNDKSSAPPKQYLVGVKNCDMRGIDVYDRVCLKWEPIDPLYRARRENTVIISADCPEPQDCCFCNLVGLTPYAEAVSDVNITRLERCYLFEALSQKGETIIEQTKDLFTEAGKEHLKERDNIRKNAMKIVQKYNARALADDLPARVGRADKKTKHASRQDCVECFACLHACPTCYCFLLSDYQKSRETERVRTWDACYYAAYARVGGGANPRSEIDDRFWNRFLCKFDYFKQYEDIYACSGCGRCWRGCSGKIDIREILWNL